MIGLRRIVSNINRVKHVKGTIFPFLKIQLLFKFVKKSKRNVSYTAMIGCYDYYDIL